jgi:hypothetical protein
MLDAAVLSKVLLVRWMVFPAATQKCRARRACSSSRRAAEGTVRGGELWQLSRRMLQHQVCAGLELFEQQTSWMPVTTAAFLKK